MANTTRKLTKTVVDHIPLTTSGQALYWDSDLPGFGLRVGMKTKTYFAERGVNGRTVRFTIGKHGVFTAEQAAAEPMR
jgi:Arm DNA-binding domain